MLKNFLTKKHTGWMAAARHGERLDILHVSRGPDARPQVLHCLQVDAYVDAPASRLAAAGRSASLRGGRFTYLLQPDEYQFIQVETPDVPEAEQHNALRWQLKDALNQSVDDTVFDTLPLPPPASSRSRPPTLVVAAARQVLAPTVQAFQSARLQLASIDVPEMALRNIANLYDTAPRGIALLHFDERGGLVVVCHEGELVTSRRFDVTAPQLALADDLRVARFERIGLELQRSLDNFDRQYSHIPVAKLVVSIPPDGESIIDFLASTLYIPVEALDLAPRVDGLERLGGCALLTLGAALRSEPQ